MQLHQLEIKGFKSFADKVLINFDNGITGIVGPNGCGKSNVVDAIRWVLGEQKTKNLRSEKMENVIFNGTKRRKPLQMAEVSLTFNNTKNILPTEYSQVTISRRYYRVGESEYLLNGVPCRLKDINNLFMDTGIGPDSYAIIELKMVDEILNDKDNSRRGLFEEAAGISKFKVRKKETLKKLEDTDGDLERVEDLLHEITKNMKSLERQARQAEEYFQIKNKYKSYSVALAHQSVSRFQETLDKLKGQLDAESEKRIRVQAETAQKDAGIEKLKADLLNKEKLLASRQKALNEHVNLIRQHESEKKIKNERLKFLTDKAHSLRNQITEGQRQKTEAEEKITRLEAEKQGIERQANELIAQVAELKSEYEAQKVATAELQQQLTSKNAAFRQRQDELFSLTKSLDIKQVQISTIKQELEKTTSDNAAQTADLEAMATTLGEANVQLHQKMDELQQTQQEIESIQDQLDSLETENESIRQEQITTQRQLDAKQNEYNLTKSMVDSLEGFPEAVQFLSKNPKWDKKTPLVSDIIACPDQYRVALENYLEVVLNYYVVETSETAFSAIALLSEAGKGKANFFILEKLQHATYRKPDAIGLPDGAVSVLDIVEYDSRYQKLAEHLLGNVFIVPDLAIISNSTGNLIFLTESGKVINRSVSISGGSVGLFEGKRIGRGKNLEKLQDEIEKLRYTIDKITTRQSDQKIAREELLVRKNSIQRKVQALQSEINDLNRQQITLKARQEQLTLMLQNQSLRREDFLNQLETLTEELAISRPQTEAKQAELREVERQIMDLNEELTSQNEQTSVKSNAYNTENIRLIQQQNRLNSMEQEIRFSEDTLRNSQFRLQNNQNELERTETDISTLTEAEEVGDEELVEMYKEKEAIEAGLNEAERDYYAARGEIDKTEKEVRDLTRQRELADSLTMELQGKRNETQLQITAIKDRLSVEFNVNLDAPEEPVEEVVIQEAKEPQIDENGNPVVSEEPKPAAPKSKIGKTWNFEEARTLFGEREDELRTRVNELKARLDRLGPINPMALEAYEEIKQRFDFINGQKNDLLNAKNSLLATISEIDTVARETFMTAFTTIREHFIRVFRSLFSDEDTCDLKLVDPENPLDSSIDIIARPKGKRPLTINQLSGGEKTLTAISLLFAIYLLKPAPFCIFDEVDAPLDDANIDKFNNIIRRFANESQFIIVTHNKRTMASTDVVYGITQTEDDTGVSKVVPVDLRALA
ncbi:chromosome segregation protein SMC [Cytophagaceae bacterium DM2B3-1]|uniref:Chromosome partition protein Smc n=1 Tax=Xanthocytophaga flava TaxID=3048013 RepID=A0ABT7CRM0_9BACT|nr:chromosome segregation protein SMC [Xanthocytophaga flavus]MDJ1496395.1 chromosome segregation protein SMC [Xanthocytophaga flavus]